MLPSPAFLKLAPSVKDVPRKRIVFEEELVKEHPPSMVH